MTSALSAARSTLLACCIAAVPGSVACAATPVTVVAPTQAIDGVSQATWSRRWWQWASSFPPDSSPVADRTGIRCGAGQAGKVWFLAGAFGSAVVHRHCTVPHDNYLFFPLLNYVFFPNGDAPITCAQVEQGAKAMTDGPAILVAEIDGRKIGGLEFHRQATTECFDLAVKADVPVSVYPAAGNGYYLMVGPMKPGRHTLRFGGQLPRLSQAITYDVTVR